jgi:UBX domain-containing protein 1
MRAGGQNSKSPLVAKFLQHCPQATSEEADTFLKSAEGDVELAAALFHSHQEGAGASPKPAAPQRGNNSYFVGGGKSSGQAVEAPPAPTGKLVEDLFAKARERGAQDGVPETSNPAFTGSGRRLGHLEGPSPVMAPVRRTERSVQITFYRNGFQVDDGPLRSLEDPEGKRFIEIIHRGRVPPEISAQHPNCDIAVTLADRGDEDYTAPKYKAFGGQGVRLANEATSAPPAVASSKGPVPSVARRAFVFDPNLESCSVVIQGLANTRTQVKVNPAVTTVGDLFFMAVDLLAGTVEQNVELCVRAIPAGMKALTDMSQTVDDANLRNSVVILRAKKG